MCNSVVACDGVGAKYCALLGWGDVGVDCGGGDGLEDGAGNGGLRMKMAVA